MKNKDKIYVDVQYTTPVRQPSGPIACAACAVGCQSSQAGAAAPPNLLGVSAVVFGAPLCGLICAALILQQIDSLGALGQLCVAVFAVVIVCLLVRRSGQRLAQWLRSGYEI